MQVQQLLVPSQVWWRVPELTRLRVQHRRKLAQAAEAALLDVLLALVAEQQPAALGQVQRMQT